MDMIFRRTLLSLAVGVLSLATATAAVDPKSVPVVRAGSEPKPAVAAPVVLPRLAVEQIAERNASARGGLPAWQRVSSMSLSGKLDAGKTRKDGGRIGVLASQSRAQAKAEARKAVQLGKTEADAEKVIQLPFQMDLKRPLRTRLEILFQGETAVQVYDGASGWKLRPYLGRHEVEPFSAEELKIASSQQQLDGPLIGYKAKGTTIALDGNEMVEGRGAYKLKLTLKNGDVRHVWIDAQTFLDVKIEGAPRRWDGKLRAVATYFRDYKKVDGLLIAHRLETRIEGVPGSESIYIEKVALNPALSDSRFAKPQ
jgi:hypothetical protein